MSWYEQILISLKYILWLSKPYIPFNLFHGSITILLDTCTLFPKVLPPKGNMVLEIPTSKDPEEIHQHNNEFYDAITRNRSGVLYHLVFYGFAVGIWLNIFI